MGRSFFLWLRIAVLVAGIAALVFHPSPAWVETAYANGGYATWEHIADTITAPLPWSLGDVAVLALLAGIIVAVARALRKRAAWYQRIALAVFNTAFVLAAGLMWFYASWGWNYDRAPVETRLAYDPSRLSDAAMSDLRARSISMLNRLAPAAHTRSAAPLDTQTLEAMWLPAVQRGGDAWEPAVAPAKPTIFDPFMSATGTTGFINPLTLNVHLATDLLWFERPFTQAHEWSHDAAYAREDEANYFGIITCLRSTDPVAQYSGWFELFLYLPPLQHYEHNTFSPLVWADFAALRERNKRRINLSLQQFTWQTYGTYLKSNHVTSGVENYDEVTRLMLAIPLDGQGLPIAR